MDNPIIEYYRAVRTFVTTQDTSEREKLRSTLTEMGEKANASWKLGKHVLATLLISVGGNISENEKNNGFVTQRDFLIHRVRELADAAEKDLLVIQDDEEAAKVLAELKEAIFRG